MSSTDISTTTGSNTPSSALKTDFNELIMEPVGVELTTGDALRLLAKIYELVKLGVKRPESVRFSMGAQELRIQHNTDVIVKANLKSNGTELWTIYAEHEIRRAFKPEFQRFSY